MKFATVLAGLVSLIADTLRRLVAIGRMTHLPFLCLLGLALALLGLIIKIKLSPGYVAILPEPLRTLSRHSVRICDKCRQYKPRNAHHCSLCNRCVHHMDHHCLWLDVCINSHNIVLFMRFLKMVLVSGVVFSLVLLVQTIPLAGLNILTLLAVLLGAGICFAEYHVYGQLRFQSQLRKEGITYIDALKEGRLEP